MIDPPAEDAGADRAAERRRWFVDSDIALGRVAPGTAGTVGCASVTRFREEHRGRRCARSCVAWRWPASSGCARLLLRLGPHAEVLEPAEWHDLGADAARELLARYEVTDS